MRRSPATSLSLVFLFTAVSLTGFAQAPAPLGWTTHTDPKGFSIATPPGWNFGGTDPRSGRVALRGPNGEQVIVWPASVQSLDARGAAALVQQLARQVDAQMPWGAAVASGSVVRTIAKTPQRSAAAVMTWSGGASGASFLFYYAEAPANYYRTETDTFAAIFQSFHVLPQPSAGAAQGAGKPAGTITFTTWSDPRENAFTLSVPQGWRTVGGAYRLSATDIRSGVTMASPDGQIRVRVGDSNLGTFIAPTPMMLSVGMREGTYYGLGDGSQLLIKRYLNGQQAAQQYAQTLVSKECSGVQVTSNNARADVAGTFGPKARAEGMPNAQLTAGDVTFNCSIGGIAVHGKFILATVLPLPGGSGLWYVYRLYGYLAAPGREQDAERVAEQGVQSVRINPQWQAQQQQIANNAVAADNARSQQFRQQIMQQIAKDQQETSDMIMKGWEQRNQVYDEIDRRRENAILGTLDVVDPETGRSYKIDNYSDYHWMNNSGVIAGNNTGDSPGVDWHALVTLP
jgi:hypothetical protein